MILDLERMKCNVRVFGGILLLIYALFQLSIMQLSENLSSSSSNAASVSVDSAMAGRSLYKSSTKSHTINLEDEIQKSLKYVNSIKSTERKLIFVHIPKTAGTTIEEIGGKQAKVAWGSCLFNHKPKRRGGVCRFCPSGQFEWPMKIGYWHLPPQIFPLMGYNPYDNVDLFAVVRQPNQRLLSEFYYICRRKDTKWWNTVECNKTRIYEPSYINEWIQTKLSPKSVLATRELKTTTSSAEIVQQYFDHNGHFTPQYQFVVSHPQNIRMVDYVLNMDNLQEEFPKLMNAFNVTAVMPSHRQNAMRNDTTIEKDLKASDFDSTTKELIRQIYNLDFELL